jgi:hypothetical protein
MFWKKKRGQDDIKKKMKLDPEAEIEAPRFQEMPGIFEPVEVKKNEYVTTKARIKGIWTLVEDISTGKVYYRNRLNGKIQNNPPLGIRTEDLDYEKIESIQIPDTFEAENEGGYDAEYAESYKYKAAEPGEWEEVGPSYWFEGQQEDQTDLQQSIPEITEITDKPITPKQQNIQTDESEYESDLALEISQVPLSFNLDPSSSPIKTNTTLYLKQHIDEEPSDLFIEKPVYIKPSLSTSTTFTRREKKNTLKL